MPQLILKIFLVIYIFYAFVKFFEFFFRSDETRRYGLHKVYVEGNGRIIKIFDNVMLAVMAVVVCLLFISGVEYLSFTTGLLVGMTIIQIFFHRFNEPLPPEKSPEPPITALKMLSYSVQAMPEKPWRELIFMTVLFVWALYKLFTEGFGLMN
jgi:uncharacterized membrane protein YphA (DoxX/SURF4 family)